MTLAVAVGGRACAEPHVAQSPTVGADLACWPDGLSGFGASIATLLVLSDDREQRSEELVLHHGGLVELEISAAAAF